MLSLFFLFNGLDYVLTWRALSVGHGEGNRIMEFLFALGPLPAGAFKIGTNLVVALAIWRFRRYKLILDTGIFAFLAYAGLLSYHLLGIFIYG
ncbi:MAG: DUF5658 family protein [Candidatus Aquicultorales bacterium]